MNLFKVVLILRVVSVWLTLFLWSLLPCLLVVYGPAWFREALLPFSIYFFGNPSGPFPIKGQPSDYWGLLKRPRSELSLLGPLSGLVSVEDFPLQEAQLLPHCQLLAGYHGNRSQERSAFLPSWMRPSTGLCEGRYFPLRGQEKHWLWVMSLTQFAWGPHSLSAQDCQFFILQNDCPYLEYISFFLSDG